MLKNHVIRLFDYVNWANSRILHQLQSLSGVPPKTIHLLEHVLSAEKIWLNRLVDDATSKISAWPNSGLTECDRLVRENRENYNVFLASLSEQDMLNIVTYHSLIGDLYHNSILDILTHVYQHGSYHRGQIASYLRNGGFEPVNTDYITFVREIS